MDIEELSEKYAERYVKSMTDYLGIPEGEVREVASKWKSSYIKFLKSPITSYKAKIQKSKELISKYLKWIEKARKEKNRKREEIYKGWIEKHLRRIKYFEFLIELEKWKKKSFKEKLKEIGGVK